VAETLYFGGGTPSRLGGDGLARALDLVGEWYALAAGAEVSIEANPEDVEAPAVAAWRSGGVNRVSLGGQTFDPAALAWMHRTHGAEQAERAIDLVRGGGIDDVSLDLIFALPAEVPRDWAADVSRALALSPTHLSLYGLTVEPGTALGRWAERGRVAEADEERYAAEFLHAHEALGAAGYEHYEVSNFALAGRRARHNSSYWAGVPYVGLGPSAHGFDGVARRWNVSAYAAWLRTVQAGRDPVEGCESLDEGARAAEAVYLGLRTTDGLLAEPGDLMRVSRWAEAGWVVLDGGRIRCTALGWLRLDALAADLTAFRSNS
jgi:oxygen-independent coproporphyrinogen-3 oxidase